MASSSNYVAVEEYNALLKLLNTQFTNMMGRFDEIDKQFSNIDKRLERLDTIEERLNIIESHLTTIDNRLSHLETNTSNCDSAFYRLQTDFEQTRNTRIAALRQQQNAMAQELVELQRSVSQQRRPQ
ncbi:hypothetical protein H2203_002690 [Taxawa tesnikishii (nom. ined.)]|nr:hypothetical protein H2203_002690 [Dothideales sp. JES 119]